MKITSIIAGVMAGSGVLVVLSAFLNLVDVVAIFGGVLGKQDNGWYGLVALLLGLVTLGIFFYAYRLSIWDWKIRSPLIVLSGIIFLIAIVGMADNLRADFGSGRVFTWSEGSSSRTEIIRVVRDTFAVVEVDFVLLVMLLGSIGIGAATLWGAFKWESAKTQERRDEDLRSIPDTVLAKLLKDELAMGADGGLPDNGESTACPESATVYTQPPVIAQKAPAAILEPETFQDEPEHLTIPSTSFRTLLSEGDDVVESETQPSPIEPEDEPDQPNPHSRSYRSILLEGEKGEGEPGPL